MNAIFCVKVNIAATVKKFRLSFDPLVLRLLPSKTLDCALFWAWLPTFFLLLNVGLSFLKPCVLTKFFPFLVAISAVTTFRFKTIGLATSYLAEVLFLLLFYSQIPLEARVWQMGLFFILALNIFIFLLSIEEAESCFESIISEADACKKLSSQVERDYFSAQKTAAEREKEFLEEIEKFKKEAEQRRIERVNDLKKCEFIESEIAWLVEQKESFVEESKAARTFAAEQTNRLEDQVRRFEEATLQLQLLEEENKHCQVLHKNQLHEQESLMLQIQKIREQQTQALERENKLKEDLICSQEAILFLQQRSMIMSETTKSTEEIEELNKKIRQLESLLNQMRSQFEEKSQVLAMARQELFQTQGKVWILEKENETSTLQFYGEQMAALENTISILLNEIDQLEKEIILLEELIFRSLNL